jgi:hypothetical protein
MRESCPVMTEFDYAVVENTLAKDGQNPIVACVSLHGVPGFYGDKVSILFGKPEAISSHPGKLASSRLKRKKWRPHTLQTILRNGMLRKATARRLFFFLAFFIWLLKFGF